MKGLARSLSRGSGNASPIRKLSITIKNLAVAVTNGAPGYGTAVIEGLEPGNLLFLGAVSYVQLTTADADVTATFDGDFAIGTVATADGNVSDSNEANIIPSTALGAATAKVSPLVRGVSTDALGGGIIDNTAGSLKLNLNVLIDDAAISGDAAFTANGVVHLSYIVLGDD